MKVVIDARMYGLEYAGIGRYIVNFVRELKNQKSKIKNIDLYLLVRKKYYQEIKKETENKFTLVLADYPHYSFKEQIFLPLQLIKLKPDLVHFPHFNVPIFYFGKYVVTIHDLIKHESKGSATTTRLAWFYWLKYIFYLMIVWLAVKRANKIITPSKFWQKELMKRYGLPKDKVVVTYEGIDKNFQFPIDNLQFQKILNKYKIKKPFVVYTGSLYPHKNVEKLVKAIKRLNDLNHLSIFLVIVCARNVFYERFLVKVKRLKAENFVNLVGFVSDKDLIGIYKQAEAFVFPSLWEGFGLPGLEAMALGLPVVSSNSSCLPEIYGEAALYFNPLDINEMSEKIEMVICNKKIREVLIEKGFEQVKKYSWGKMAKETLAIYKECLLLNKRF